MCHSFLGCTAHNNSRAPISDYSSTIKKAETRYKVFIDNSLSMDGYWTPPYSDFRVAINTIVSDVQAGFSKATVNLYVLNGYGSCPLFYSSQMTNLLTITPEQLRVDCPPGNNSALEDMIDSATHSLGDRTVAIIFTDAILSQDKSGSTGVAIAGNAIKVYIAKYSSKNNLSTIVLKFNANFNGDYYSESGHEMIRLSETIQRPFYALIFGTPNTLATLLPKLNLTKYNCKATYCAIANNNNSLDELLDPHVSYQDKQGSFILTGNALDIKEARPIINPTNNSNTFGFTIDINSNIPFTQDFFTNIHNWNIDGGGYTIDKIYRNSFYHIAVHTDNFVSTPHTINIGLQYTIPRWVENSSTDDDSNPTDQQQQNETFGLSYLIGGFNDGYLAQQTGNKNQYTLSVNISPEGAESHTLRNGVLIFLVIAGIAYKMYRKK
ncbi:MAG: hypothetical protein QM528_05120 [Phycisphaerales bacterium]|nr:hypothetical protein [Phycisphaerales bacterium]